MRAAQTCRLRGGPGGFSPNAGPSPHFALRKYQPVRSPAARKIGWPAGPGGARARGPSTGRNAHATSKWVRRRDIECLIRAVSFLRTNQVPRHHFRAHALAAINVSVVGWRKMPGVAWGNEAAGSVGCSDVGRGPRRGGNSNPCQARSWPADGGAAGPLAIFTASPVRSGSRASHSKGVGARRSGKGTSQFSTRGGRPALDRGEKFQLRRAMNIDGGRPGGKSFPRIVNMSHGVRPRR